MWYAKRKESIRLRLFYEYFRLAYGWRDLLSGEGIPLGGHPWSLVRLTILALLLLLIRFSFFILKACCCWQKRERVNILREQIRNKPNAAFTAGACGGRRCFLLRYLPRAFAVRVRNPRWGAFSERCRMPQAR